MNVLKCSFLLEEILGNSVTVAQMTLNHSVGVRIPVPQFTMQNIIGHDTIAERFRKSEARGRLSGSFLFVGNSGIGKRRFAVALAKSLLCKENGLDACGKCSSCALFDTPYTSSHPDFYYVSRPEGKSSLPLELIVGDKEHRGRSGLLYELSRTPFYGGYKIAIIDDADYLNTEGANALLKTLEEPPPNCVMILIGTSTTKQLPTIRSRCRLIRFAPLAKTDLAKVLLQENIVDSQEKAARLAEQSDGSVDSAMLFLDDSIEKIKSELYKALSAKRIPCVAFAKHLNEYIDSAGKKSTLKRNRLRVVFGLTLDFLRKNWLCDSDGNFGVTRKCVKMADRTLEAMEQIDRNINVPFIIDAWMQDLAAI